jgi:hypothetical protein
MKLPLQRLSDSSGVWVIVTRYHDSGLAMF